MVKIGIKTDPINTRYSYDWLFELLREEGAEYVQLGSFFELYTLEDDYFYALKEKAQRYEIRIRSAFTAHRELGGFFYGDVFMERAARRNYERFIEVAAILGVEYCGSNPGAVHRDALHLKQEGIACYLRHMKELIHFAREKGLKGLTIEPMSCLAEPPTLPEEVDAMMKDIAGYRELYPDTVPVYLCSDISHGYVNSAYETVHSNMELFEHNMRYMAEFHFKNTDQYYNSTFGFSPEEQAKGVVDLEEVRRIINRNENLLPVPEVIGYLEIGGPKLGRDYSDKQLEQSLRTSLRAIREIFVSPTVVL